MKSDNNPSQQKAHAIALEYAAEHELAIRAQECFSKLQNRIGSFFFLNESRTFIMKIPPQDLHLEISAMVSNVLELIGHFVVYELGKGSSFSWLDLISMEFVAPADLIQHVADLLKLSTADPIWPWFQQEILLQVNVIRGWGRRDIPLTVNIVCD